MLCLCVWVCVFVCVCGGVSLRETGGVLGVSGTILLNPTCLFISCPFPARCAARLSLATFARVNSGPAAASCRFRTPAFVVCVILFLFCGYKSIAVKRGCGGATVQWWSASSLGVVMVKRTWGIFERWALLESSPLLLLFVRCAPLHLCLWSC